MTANHERPAANYPGKLLIVTGVSGTGKSTAIKALEDLGYYCIDNLPGALVTQVLALTGKTDGRITRVALGIDIREKAFLGRLPDVLNNLSRNSAPYEILFLDADTSVLVKRYSESQRRHPLDTKGNPIDSIEKERERLMPLHDRASRFINTTSLTAHDLKALTTKFYSPGAESGKKLALKVMSFGYRNGIPMQADLIFDTRFLPNPHYVPELRFKTGNDPEVRDYILKTDPGKAYLRRLESLLRFLLPQFAGEKKSYLTIALGCTGGQHRSIAVANALGSYLKRKKYPVTVEHRDIGLAETE